MENWSNNEGAPHSLSTPGSKTERLPACSKSLKSPPPKLKTYNYIGANRHVVRVQPALSPSWPDHASWLMLILMTAALSAVCSDVVPSGVALVTRGAPAPPRWTRTTPHGLNTQSRPHQQFRSPKWIRSRKPTAVGSTAFPAWAVKFVKRWLISDRSKNK